MQSCILFSALVGACLVLVPGNAKAENEQIQFLLPPINPGDAPQPVAAVDESNEEDKKLLLPLLALKPLVIASGLLAGNKLQKKKPSTPRPNNSVPPAENTVLVSIGDETDDQKEDTLEEEARKLLLPLLTLKPLLFASILAGSKLPASSIPKPGIGFTITKHESATSPPVTTTPASTTTTTTQKPPSNTTTTPPIDNTCLSLNGFPCYRLPSGCVCLVSTQKPWIDAYNYCAANGRKLISIPNVARQLEISTYLPSVIGKDKVDIFSYIGFWTSGIYALTAYTWASIPQYFTYTNWIVGNPDITNLPRATCIRAAPAENYQWDDIDCGQFLPFICE
ncbi:hypothetical protein DAPPUDRAFT_324383 [Daphnia pulex]|uniref:C-type lectin domain-containing protein n=1 Tax=Daphnia pulex TaxID=6669 RepID=E9H198_DAPPU|nr:hypothetical protein DAPPUDRAFT_324383 [Daphnia pulex]|eukprot:EFX74454.1 hypothetical protein DAPPUDRAFT_324383 [Daphnia pulex]